MVLNPLLLPEVIFHVLQFLSVDEVLKVRLVSKSWNRESKHYISCNKVIILSEEIKFKEFYEIASKNEDQPFKSFDIRSLPYKSSSEEEKSGSLINFTEFCKKCAPSFHRVVLNLCENLSVNYDLLSVFHYHNINKLTSITFYQLPINVISTSFIIHTTNQDDPQNERVQAFLPCLERLTIFSDEGYCRDFLAKFISLTRRLRHLKIEHREDTRNFKKYMLDAIFINDRYLGYLQSLQYFIQDAATQKDPSSSWEQRDCDQLATMSILKLDSLKLPLHRFTDEYMLLQRFMTLIQLELRVHTQIPHFPKMSHLVSLILYDYEGPFNFLENLPSLRHLGLCEYSPANNSTTAHLMMSSKIRCESLMSLNMYGSYKITNEMFKILAQQLPQLRSLNFWHVDNEKLKTVFQHFLKLEVLIVNLVNVNDETITGIPQDLCECMERDRCLNLTHFLKQPTTLENGIGQLKNIRKLEFHGSCLTTWRWSSVSDVSIYFGISRLSTITSLSLYDFKWVTEEGILHLCQLKRLCYLKIDKRSFSEDVLQEIHTRRPDITIDFVTNEWGTSQWNT